MTRALLAGPRAYALLASLALAALPALAEGEQEGGLVPYINESGLLVGGGMTSGVLLPDGGGYARACEEAFDPAGFPPSFSLLRSDGVVLIGGHAGLFESSDLGCSYQAVSGPLEARGIGAVALSDDALFLVTSDFSRANGVWISIDGGEQWSPALDEQDGVSFARIAASVDGTRMVISGTHVGASTAPAVFTSEDSGVTWQDCSAAYADFPLVIAATFDIDDQAVLFGGFDQSGGGFVLQAAPPYDNPVALGTLPSSVTHVAVLGDTRYALAQLRGAYFKMGPGDAAFVDATSDDTPTNCLFSRRDGTGLVGCGRRNLLTSAGVFSESTDGTTWTATVGWDDIRYRKCPTGTIGATACARFLESACNDNEDNDADGLTDCDDPDCSDNAVCGGGEGEGEGEGDVGGEGEGEGPPPPGTCACAGVDGTALAFALLGLIAVRRRRLP